MSANVYTMPKVNITWQTPLTNAIINVDGDIEKNAGVNNCFTDASGTGDAGARSVETVSASDGDWEFGCTLGPLGGAAGRTFVGVDHTTFTLQFADWDACLHVSTENNTIDPHPPDTVFAYEGGPPKKTYRNGIWNEGDLLRIVCRNNVIRYYLNCLLLYTSPRTPIYPLFAVCSLACLNKTVIDPYFKTGLDAGQEQSATPGSETGDACSPSWTIPTPSAFPFPAAGGPQYAYFDEIEPDWGEHAQTFGDGKPEANTIQTAAVRRFAVEWEGLDESQAAIIDDHYEGSRAGLAFSLTNPRTAEVLTGVRYERYERSPHRKVWAQSRRAELVRYTS